MDLTHELEAMALTLEDAQTRIKELDAIKKDASSKIIELLGEGNSIEVNGLRINVSVRSERKTLDSTRLRAEEPVIFGMYSKTSLSSPTVKLTRKKAKE